MSNRLFNLSAIILLAGAGLAYAQCPVPAKHDLDLYSEEQLKADLYDELDDILVGQGGQMQPNGQYSIGALRAAILYALSDQGDTGLETEIDWCDLELEMEEAKPTTTVEEVLDDALAEVNANASQSEISSRNFTRVNFTNDSLLYVQSENQRSTPNAAIPTFITRLIAKIRSAL